MPEIGADIGVKADESPRQSDSGHRLKRRGTAGFGTKRDRADVQPLPGAEWREIGGVEEQISTRANHKGK